METHGGGGKGFDSEGKRNSMLRNQARSVGDQGSGFCVLFLFSRLFLLGGLWCFYLLLLFSYVLWSLFFIYITVLSLCLVSFVFVI